MPVTHLPEVCTKTGTRKPVPVSDVSDVQFGTEYFWYQFLVSNGTCCILMPFMVPAFWYEFSAPISGMYHGYFAAVFKASHIAAARI